MINEPSEMYPILVYRNDEVIALFKHYNDYEKFIDTLQESEWKHYGVWFFGDECMEDL